MARTFNGTSQYATVGTSTAHNSTDVTISVWIYVPSSESLSSGSRRIVEIGGYNGGTPLDGFGIEWNASTDVVSGNVWEGGNWTTQIATWSLVKDQWNHLAITARLTTSELNRFFVNGTKQGSDLTSGGRSANTQAMAIATENGSAGSSLYEGYIAELAIFSTNLSDADVALLAAGDSPVAVDEANLVRYWRMDGSAGTEDDYVSSATMTYTGSPGTTAGPTVDDPPTAGQEATGGGDFDVSLSATLSGTGAVAVPGIVSETIKEPNESDQNVANSSVVTVRVWHGATITGAPDEVLSNQSITDGVLTFEPGVLVGDPVSYQARWEVGDPAEDRFFEVLNDTAADLNE